LIKLKTVSLNYRYVLFSQYSTLIYITRYFNFTLRLFTQ